jgi:hypothetical protein
MTGQASRGVNASRVFNSHDLNQDSATPFNHLAPPRLLVCHDRPQSGVVQVSENAE